VNHIIQTYIFVDFGDTGKILLSHCIIWPLYFIAEQTGLPTSHVHCGRKLNYFIMYGSSKSKSSCGIVWVREHWYAHVIVCCSGRSLECSSVKILVHQIEI